MGVAEDFSTLYKNARVPSSRISDISYRYRRITRQLNLDFWGSYSETSHSLFVGSYGRDTASDGLSDLDVGFMLPVAYYHKYHNYIGNGQSALLQEVKRSIQKTYATSESFGDGQVVVINFQDGMEFEILPYFENNDGMSWTFPNANSGGKWDTCNPRAEIKAIHDRHLATNKNLKKLCRLARIWKRVCAVPISGILIDTLAYQFLGKYEHRDKSFVYYDWMFRDFFEHLWLQNESQTYWKAPGSGDRVNRKGVFENKARSANLRAIEAIKLASDGYEWSSRQKWREVFGSYYPA